MWTKQQLIDEALAELAIQGFVFDLTAEERLTGLRRLDAMMAEWEARGVRVGYAFGSVLTADSGVPDYAVQPILTNLACRLAAGYGKVLEPETKRQAREGFGLLLRAAAQPGQQQLPSTLPRGAGNRLYSEIGRPFFPEPDRSPLGVAADGLTIAPE